MRLLGIIIITFQSYLKVISDGAAAPPRAYVTCTKVEETLHWWLNCKVTCYFETFTNKTCIKQTRVELHENLSFINSTNIKMFLRERFKKVYIQCLEYETNKMYLQTCMPNWLSRSDNCTSIDHTDRFCYESDQEEKQKPNIFLIIVLSIVGFVLFIVIIFSLCYLIIYKLVIKKRNKREETIEMWTIQNRSSGWSYSNTALGDISDEIGEDLDKRIHISKLEDYVIERRNDNRLREEFESLPKKAMFSCNVATLKENEMKNRCNDNIPYDYTRVVLDVLPNDPHSDYINASYINGYKTQNKYIATQGPKPLRMVDFWRMVWQERCSKIVMITNLVEHGETKCKKYWPKKTNTYGNIKVQLIDQDVFVDFTIRTFIISKDDEENLVKQFHFTTWPENQIPLYTSSLLTFLGKIRDYRPVNQIPIIVHSSIGTGRTGAFILLDYMLDMIQWEDHVNFMKCLYEMRQQRMNMVQTAEQYIFIYETILDALWPFNTSIQAHEFIQRLSELKSIDPNSGFSYIENEYKRLNRLYPPSSDDPFNTLTSFGSTIRLKGCHSSSLHVAGYRKRKAFIVGPIPHSTETKKFWNFVNDSNSLTIVLLNDLDSIADQGIQRYWTREGCSINFEEFSLEYVNKEIEDAITIRNFKIVFSEKKKETKIIKHFQLTSWKSNERIPSSPHLLIDLLNKIEKWQQETVTHAIIIQCLDGIRASGVFCVCSFISNKIKLEHEVDIYLAAKTIREASANFIESLEQYNFFYNFAKCFLKRFRNYANFS